MFGLTGEALANRVRDAAKAAGLGDSFSGHSGRIGMARRVVAAGAPTAAVQHQGPWRHGRPAHQGRGRQPGLGVADLMGSSQNACRSSANRCGAGCGSWHSPFGMLLRADQSVSWFRMMATPNVFWLPPQPCSRWPTAGEAVKLFSRLSCWLSKGTGIRWRFSFSKPPFQAPSQWT